MNEIKSRIFELREIINNHNYHYYDLDKNIISDFEYDKLLNELVNLESKYPEFYDENSSKAAKEGIDGRYFST